MAPGNVSFEYFVGRPFVDRIDMLSRHPFCKNQITMNYSLTVENVLSLIRNIFVNR